jgi:hypothetical protein
LLAVGANLCFSSFLPGMMFITVHSKQNLILLTWEPGFSYGVTPKHYGFGEGLAIQGQADTPRSLNFFPPVPPPHPQAVLSTAQSKGWRTLFLMTNSPMLRRKMVEKHLPFPVQTDLFQPSPPKALPISHHDGQKSFGFSAWTSGTNGTPMTRMSRAVSIL